MTMMSRLALGGGTLAATVAVLSACGGGGGSGGEGMLRMALTDAPACGYDQVNVTVERVEVNRSSNAAEGDGSWETIVLSQPRRVNLLDLTNGVLQELGSTQLPAGRYTQLRLVLAKNTAQNPLANSVLPTGGTETALDTPSAQQSGLKLKTDIEVQPNQVADFVLDFDACKSIVSRGNSRGYNLKPVLSVLPRTTAAGLRVQGQVVAALGGAATVSLQQNGVVVRSTVAMTDNPDTAENEAGRFVLSPVPAGSYDLVVTAEGRVAAVITGVPVTETAPTYATPASYPINPPAGTPRTASGSVTTTGSPAIPDATVRALQTLGTTKIELSGRPVDAETGAYGFSLVAGAPVKAGYSTTAAPSFTADTTASGRYTLEASVPGQAVQTRAIDVTNGNAQASFSFTR